MRPCSQSGVPVILSLLGLLSRTVLALERHYYIAAVPIDWSYTAPDGNSSGPTYKKVVFREYDAGFKQAKAHPPWLGLLGPTLRGQEGDVIVVTFRNMADKPCSIHPHGIAYGKQSEGSLYFDNTSLFEKEDDQVLPGEEHTYHWEVTPEVSPKEDDPPCVTYNYISHYDIVRDYNSGLIGAMLVCKKGSLNDAGEQILFSQEYVLLFGVFNESKSWYTTESVPPSGHVKYTINGYTNGTIPGLSVCAHTAVSWHLLGMSSQPELFSVHFNGQVMLHMGHRVSSVGLISGTATGANMTSSHPGRWLLSSYVSRHMEAGMHGYLNVQTCEGFAAPVRRLTIQQRLQSQEWTYYIAAEEVVWDYAPHMPDYIDSEYRAKYLRSSPDRIGRRYKKAVFTQYVDDRFTVRLEHKQRKMETGVLGPVIRAQIRDVVKIVFKNMATRPYSIYPHGLTINKAEEGASYPAGGNQSGAVLPGETHTYEWKVLEENEPTGSDSRCLTRMYHSAVDTPRDIASGLIGPLLICKSQSLNKKNVQLKADKEQQAVLAVFDENKSWYIEDNIKSYCGDPSIVNKADPEFYNSNVMHSINGYVYDSGQVLGFCNGEIVTWHMSSVGEQDHIQSATWHGHSFELNDGTEDILSLFPMSGETITMSMNNIGHWLMSSLNSYEAKKGMRLKFKDLECYRDYYYEDTDKAEEKYSVNIWQPEDMEKLKEEERRKEEEKMKKKAVEPTLDKLTAFYAEEYGFDIRTFKNRSQGPADDVELLDLSLFDYSDQVYPTKNTTENQSLSSSTTSQNQTPPVPGSEKIPTNFSLAEGVVVDENLTMTASFNGSRNTTRQLNETAGHLHSNVKNALTNVTVAETTKLDVQRDQTVVLTLETNITSKITHPVESVVNVTSLSHLNGSSADNQGETIPDPANASHTQNTTAKVSKDRTTGITSFSYAVPLSKPSSNSSLIEMDNEDKEHFVLLDSGGVSVEIHTGNAKEMAKAGVPYSVSPALTFPDENQKTLVGSEGAVSDAENTACNASCLKRLNVTGPRVEIHNINGTNNGNLSVKISNSTAQMNYTLYVEATSMPGGNRTDYTSARSPAFPKLQSDNETSPETVALTSQEDVVQDVGTKALSLEHSNTSEEVSSERENSSIISGRNITFPPGSTNLTSSQNYTDVSREFELHVGNISLTVLGSSPGSEHSNISEELSSERENSSIISGRNITFPPGSTNLTSSQNYTDVSREFELHVGNISLTVLGSSPGSEHSNISEELSSERENSSIISGRNITFPPGSTNLTSSQNYTDVSREFELHVGNISLTVLGSSPGSEHSNISEELSSERENSSIISGRNITFPPGSTNLTSSQNYTDVSRDLGHIEEPHVGNVSFTSPGSEQDHHSDSEQNMSESQEEVVIYLKNNTKEAILTVSLDLQKEHWSYEGGHKLVPMDVPANMTKYTWDEPKTSGNESNSERQDERKKKGKKRKWPASTNNMKTRKKKVYKAQPSSGISPRGRKPPAFAPRGSRPITSEEDLSLKSIVIGVPRRDFNDYDLFVLNTNEDPHYNIPQDNPGDDYEYVDYKDPYSQQSDFKGMDDATKEFLKEAGANVKMYFIAAEEVEWDYAGYGQRRQERINIDDEPTQFIKVIFRSYLDSSFTTPENRGEVDEHLGLLGPIIKAEVDQTIMVVFKNLATRPYSLHPHGVSYSKQMEGLKYDDDSPYWYKLDNEVQPDDTYTYIWKVDSKFGPKSGDSDCRTWAYHSGVNPEKDINSGLIGALLVCRKGTLEKDQESAQTRDFVLLFMTFDETKSWYYERNMEMMQRKHRRAVLDPNFTQNIHFPAINGIIFSLKGLRMYTDLMVRWHLINMGSPKDFHSIHFHGQTFLDKQTKDHRQGVFPLLPGSFADLEMRPSKPGLWQLETEVGDLQQRGMQTLFLVIDNSCEHPLGLISQSVKDSQITASHYTGEWRPHLARLHNSGKYNAWSTDQVTEKNWIQVDFQRPVVISKVATQGAKQFFTSHYVENYTISYSTDRRKWIVYKGISNRKTFKANENYHEVKENTFFPPLIGRFVRLVPTQSYNRPTVRLEYYGCELDGCSVPLGMENGRIRDLQITASSVASSWFSGPWQPWLARLNKQGTVNAWQAKTNNMQQWLQVELKDVKKITGIVTQGAKSMGTEMFVTEYTIEYSKDGKTWVKYKEDEDDFDPKIFPGNEDNNDHVKNYIYPPIFSRFIRIIPRRWQKTITMRIELLGCDFE